MVNIFNKSRSVVAIDLSNDLLTKAVLIATDGEKYYLEGWDYYSEQESGDTNFLQNFKPEAITVSLGDAHTLCFAIADLNSFNLEMEKRKRGLSVDTQYSDFLKISHSSILAAIHKDMAQEVLKSVRDTFPSIPQISINQSMAALMYLYLRSYRPQPELRTAILHWAGNFISLLVAQTELPVWEGSIELTSDKREDAYVEISALLQSANEKLAASHYDLLILAGEFDSDDVKKMNNFASQVELMSPYRNGAFELGRNLGARRKEAQLEGHQLAVAIASAGMILEHVGLNLADTDIELRKELPLERVIEIEQTLVNIISNTTKATVKKTIPLLLEQSKILVAGLIIAVGLFGYRFYNNYQENKKLIEELAKEEIRAAQLVDIRTKHDEYNRKITAIKDRTATIGEIRKEQLTVRTVLKQIDLRITQGIVFSELTIDKTNVKIKGYAPERPAVFEFAKQLGSSVDVFSDVVPVYDDKTNIGNYEINCRYIGTIPFNNLPTENTVKTTSK
ncbi:MAG: hypothetical protein JNM06_08285 [Blastocatellia bacterium]|nr:hypothetical protein [Blastocatellia bacterium]